MEILFHKCLYGSEEGPMDMNWYDWLTWNKDENNNGIWY